MGEDAKGAAENVSKLRQQMLALTGVDIQLDDTTYKSTYQILLEISKVWGKLDDLSRSSVLEQLFGKRQANIGAAILENGDLLEKVYKSAENSAGSAMREQEEYAKSIQYSIDTLKASYQDLSQTVINSDFVKTLLSGAQEFLEVLTAIIDKFGTFPTLLASVGAVGSFNKMGFFKVVEDDATKGGNAVALFGKKIKDVIRDYQEADAGRIGENKISQALSGMIGFSQSDLSAIEKYNSLIESGVDKTEAFEKSMAGASNGAKSFVQSGKAATASVTGLSISEKAATIATEALGVALNTALSFGIGLLIQAIITGITKLVNAEKEAEEKAREMQEQAAETARNYLEEKQSLEELTNEYVSLATTTSDLASQKQKLLDIQDKMNESIATQTDKVDLLNKSLAENLKLTAEQEYANAKATVSELSTQAGIEHMEAYSTKEAEKVRNKIEREFLDILNAEYGDIATVNGDYWFANGWTLGERVENYQAIINLYSEWEGHNNDILDQMNAIQRNAEEIYKKQTETNEAYNKAVKIVEDYDKAYNSDLGGRVGEILESARDLSVVLSESNSAAEKYNALQGIENLELQARNLAGTNEVLNQQIDSVFNTINAGSQSVIKSVGDLRSAWFETLDEMQKGSLKNIDTMKTALQSVAEGNYLSNADFWGLAELDVDHILDGAQLIGDKFQVTEEQLIKLKDTYIQKQIEQLRIQNQTLQDQIDGTNGVNEGLKQQLEFESLILEAQIAKGVNSTGDARLVNEQRARVNSIKDSMRAYGEEIERNNLLIKQLNGSLGDTVDRQQAINKLAKKYQEEADNLLNAYEGAFDIIIDGYEAEKKALEANKEELQEQLDLLKEQADLIQEQIDNYDKAAEAVKNAIKGEIDALKAQNEERESALDLAEKLANLENAKNNKVRTYTEAGGWQYEAKKADVEKAQREVDKAQTDQRIKALEEYLQKWEDLATKRQKEEDERLAAQILGADWRQKIAEQDEDIFKQYEEEYDSYGEQLERISSIETSTVQKSLDNVNEQIAAKDKEIQKWQNYKSEVSSAAQTAKKEMSEWYTEALKIATDMGSDEGKVAGYLDDFYYRYKTILTNLKTYQDELNAAVNNFDPETLGEKFTEIADIDWDKVLDALKEYNRHINSNSDARLHAEGYYADGGVASYTGLAMLHGSKQNPELILNAKDTAKLYNMIHSSPTLTPTAITGNMRIAQNLSAKTDTPNSISVNVANLNLPNVQNAEQFARQMESYMQTVLTESQVFKPRR